MPSLPIDTRYYCRAARIASIVDIMGLFDDSDSDCDTANVAAGGHISMGGVGGGYNDNDDDEDPLDAYMKSIEPTQATTTTTTTTMMPSTVPLDASLTTTSKKGNANSNSFGGGRLDVDAEEEATSHWEMATPAPSSSLNSRGGGGKNNDRRLLDKYADRTTSESTAITATSTWEKSAADAQYGMTSTFVRAAGCVAGGGVDKKKQSGNNGNTDLTADDNVDDDDDDDLQDIAKLQKSIKEQQLQMIHQEVDPLERINHELIQYDAYTRVFYHPTNTPAGIAWRKEHDVVCSPSSFDPILGFGELAGTSGDGGDNGDGGGAGIFPEELLRAIAQSGYDSPTLVQSQTLSVALSGHDALITVRVHDVCYWISLCVCRRNLPVRPS